MRKKLGLVSVAAMLSVLASGCLDPAEHVDGVHRQQITIAAGTSDPGPYVYDVTASAEVAEAGVWIEVYLRPPNETSQSACVDLGLGDFSVEIELRYPATDQTWTRSYTRTSCRPYLVTGELPCDLPGTCSGQFEVRVHSLGLAAEEDFELEFRAESVFENGAPDSAHLAVEAVPRG